MSNYDHDEDYEKKMAYLKVRSKMESILNKTKDLKSKVNNLKSNAKVSLTIDDDIYKLEDFNKVSNNIEELIIDINSTLSSINSQV